MDKSERTEGVGRIRRCAVSHDTLPESALVRFVVDGEGRVFPDPAARAPGRGVWVGATRAAVDAAVKKGAFARSLKRAALASPDLSDRTANALRERCLKLLSLAKKAGSLILGKDQVAAYLRMQAPAWRIEASDGSADGRAKLNGLSLAWGSVPTVGCFSAAELGMALGRDVVIHALLGPSDLATSWTNEIRRLGGFIPLIPDDWPKDMSDDMGLDQTHTLAEDGSDDD